MLMLMSDYIVLQHPTRFCGWLLAD